MTRQAKNNSRREYVKVQANGFGLEGVTLYLTAHTEYQPWCLAVIFNHKVSFQGW